MPRAEGGLGRLPDEMDPPWMEEALSGALRGGMTLGAWDCAHLLGIIKTSRMPSVQFEQCFGISPSRSRQKRKAGHRHRLFPMALVMEQRP